MDYEALLTKGVRYVNEVRKETSKFKVNSPGFISLLAALTFADEHNIDFNGLVDILYQTRKFRTVDKLRSDFMLYRDYRCLKDSVVDEDTDETIVH